MPENKKAKAKKKAKHVSQKAPVPKEVNPVVPVLPPVELPEEDEGKKKDEFFDEEEMKEFSVKDEEEDTDEEAGGGKGEPAWDEGE